MPQKKRSQKERAAARRETGQMKMPPLPAPIAEETENEDLGLARHVPSAPKRRPVNALTSNANAIVELDYSYVYSDLRRILLLALLCFGIMIALAFVLP